MPKWYGESALSPDNLIPAGQQWKILWSRFKHWADNNQNTYCIYKCNMI